MPPKRNNIINIIMQIILRLFHEKFTGLSFLLITIWSVFSWKVMSSKRFYVIASCILYCHCVCSHSTVWIRQEVNRPKTVIAIWNDETIRDHPNFNVESVCILDLDCDAWWIYFRSGFINLCILLKYSVFYLVPLTIDVLWPPFVHMVS